ncbi:homeobox protein DTH-2 [Exaiptasia diaphana]|uniref:Homeobox domain-containing protein n=1 Tax=Exaiptasia diaphana TaxID=2652724 RepID=A0A913XMZ2_EXADI|nr:homeobox protein DTH-2 [Exaiptasia diaphana]KXJ25523.1 Homeobox protein ceh-24 [Exaiptasia diaphana]
MSCGKGSHPFSVESLLGLGKNFQDSLQKQQEVKTEPQPSHSVHDIHERTLPCYEDKREQLNDFTEIDEPSRKRRQRVLFNESQIHILKSVFARQKYLSPEGRKSLADSLNLSPKQVKTWFQNYRYKCRRKIYSQVRCYEEKPGQRLTTSNVFDASLRGSQTNIHFPSETNRWDNKSIGISPQFCDIPYYFPYTNNLRLIQK